MHEVWNSSFHSDLAIVKWILTPGILIVPTFSCSVRGLALPYLSLYYSTVTSYYLSSSIFIVQPPTLTFKTRSGSINVLEHIGVHYRQLGVLLLEDATAEVTQAIIEQYSHDTTKIICTILQKWIQGKGKLPIEWSTLVRVLKDIGLHMLADEMEQNLKDQYWLHVGKKGEAICMCSGVYGIHHHTSLQGYGIHHLRCRYYHKIHIFLQLSQTRWRWSTRMCRQNLLWRSKTSWFIQKL